MEGMTCVLDEVLRAPRIHTYRDATVAAICTLLYSVSRVIGARQTVIYFAAFVAGLVLLRLLNVRRAVTREIAVSNPGKDEIHPTPCNTLPPEVLAKVFEFCPSEVAHLAVSEGDERLFTFLTKASCVSCGRFCCQLRKDRLGITAVLSGKGKLEDIPKICRHLRPCDDVNALISATTALICSFDRLDVAWVTAASAAVAALSHGAGSGRLSDTTAASLLELERHLEEAAEVHDLFREMRAGFSEGGAYEQELEYAFDEKDPFAV
jgi:hypothetical protein